MYPEESIDKYVESIQSDSYRLFHLLKMYLFRMLYISIMLYYNIAAQKKINK